MNWNPNSPATIGLEWPVVESGTDQIASINGLATTLTALVSENVVQIATYVDSILGSGTAKLVMDVYDTDDVLPSGAGTSTFMPNEDVLITGVVNEAGASTNLYQSIDEAVADDDTTRLVFTQNDEYSFRAAVGSGNLAGKRPTTVTMRFSARREAPTASSLVPYVNIGGTKAVKPAEVINNAASYSDFAVTWDHNPVTGLPWTIADLEAFDTTDEFGFEAPSSTSVNVTRVAIEVAYVTENRVATGSFTVNTGWQTATMATPTGGTWAKVAGNTYLVVMHTVTGIVAVIPWLDSEAAPPFGWTTQQIAKATTAGTIDSASYPSGTGDYVTRTRSYPLVLFTTGPTASDDAQPYARLREEEVYAGRTVETEFTAPSAVTVGLVKAVVAQQQRALAADLVASLVRRATGATVGTATIDSADDVSAPRRDLQVAVVNIDVPVLLVNAAQYALRFSTTATSGNGWKVAVLDTIGSAANAENFGGTTDRGTIAGVESSDYDSPATIATVPTAPTNFDARLIADARGGHALLTWTATALGADFGHYEIQRNDSTAGWQTIAEPGTEATVQWEDHEGNRGEIAYYRMRVVRDDGAASAWTAADSVLTTTDGCTWVLATNENPDLSLALDVLAPLGWTPIEHVTEMEFDGRDYAVAFREMQERGDRFSLRVLLNSDDRPLAERGRAMFDALESLVQNAELSYLAVLDPYGRRWLASVTLGDLTYQAISDTGYATLNIRETTATPSTPSSQP